MIKLGDAREVGVGLVDKGVGLAFELAGTITGNDRLKVAGRTRQEAGTERLMAVEEEGKATGKMMDAEIQENRQKALQPDGKRSEGRSIRDQDSAPSAAAERAKGLVKESFGKITGNDRLEAEGEAQQDKGKAQGAAAKHDAKASGHQKKADVKRAVSERQRKSS